MEYCEYLIFFNYIEGIISEYSSLFLTQKYCLISEDLENNNNKDYFLVIMADHDMENISVKILQNFSFDVLGGKK